METTEFNLRRGTWSDDGVLRIERRLPGPIERVWAYLTRAELRRQWLADGEMHLQAGSAFELVWRNDELSDSPSERPAGFPAEHRATCRLTEVDPPHRLRYEWPAVGEVCFELAAAGDDEVLLRLTHRRLQGERQILDVCAGWHAHLARLVALCRADPLPSVWSTWQRLRADYARELALTGT